jgi:ribosome assembly protein YihI (activator of Der GTPase)
MYAALEIQIGEADGKINELYDCLDEKSEKIDEQIYEIDEKIDFINELLEEGEENEENEENGEGGEDVITGKQPDELADEEFLRGLEEEINNIEAQTPDILMKPELN